MKLRIGILDNLTGWQVILSQIGLPYSLVESTMSSDDFSIIVGSEIPEQSKLDQIIQYLNQGGALLCSTNLLSKIKPAIKFKSSFIDYLVPEKHPILESIGIIDVYTKCKIPENANLLKSSKGIYTAFIAENNERIIALPFCPDRMIQDNRTAVKLFYSPSGKAPFEEVSKVSKGEIRKLVAQCIEYLHHSRGLPYVQLWHLPDDYPAIFCFRIDTDSSTKKNVEKLYYLIHKNKIKASWFVDVKNNESFITTYRKFRLQEIGTHCFEHVTYDKYEPNLENIRKANQILRKSGIRAKGFVAPYGVWNIQLGKAIKDAGFSYSSEFAYDYDNLPGTPQLDQASGVLQIPIHPICIGNLKQQGYNIKQMIHYFEYVISKKLAQREPIILYHHPNDNYLIALNWLFKKIKKLRIPVMTLLEFAKWWNRRINLQLEIEYSGNILQVLTKPSSKSLCLRITNSDRTESFIKVSKQVTKIEINKISRKPITSSPITENHLKVKKFDFKTLILVLRTKTIKLMNFLRK